MSIVVVSQGFDVAAVEGPGVVAQTRVEVHGNDAAYQRGEGRLSARKTHGNIERAYIGADGVRQWGEQGAVRHNNGGIVGAAIEHAAASVVLSGQIVQYIAHVFGLHGLGGHTENIDFGCLPIFDAFEAFGHGIFGHEGAQASQCGIVCITRLRRQAFYSIPEE